ncbi:(2Fe-2S) ferredoxin domain-containing protein [Lichenicoccus roseus]|uniref:(2Fe-2S) ferredoxin domain-containing protein n=1 Tax=Lichenicoccus roseus TaxID=2683649 RepID=A0A5R9J3U7_9PROT|nr:(2Fe-2S) ferredoxin domain-containing protein [Lichenicoccus roseus]TLU71533.1 (2Fe-2S) ferredoxin domain-containing protein [Lichenicoccus roseus]
MAKHRAAEAAEIITRPSPWLDMVVICRKCSRKLKGGYGDKGRDELRHALQDGLRAVGRRRQTRIVETGCFGICPKGAVVAIRGSEPQRILIVPKRQPTEALLMALGFTQSKPG